MNFATNKGRVYLCVRVCVCWYQSVIGLRIGLEFSISVRAVQKGSECPRGREDAWTEQIPWEQRLRDRDNHADINLSVIISTYNLMQELILCFRQTYLYLHVQAKSLAHVLINQLFISCQNIIHFALYCETTCSSPQKTILKIPNNKAPVFYS